MKKITILSFCIGISYLLNSCASIVIQDTPPPKIATFENELSKDQNYVLANEWMVESFNNATSVIQFTDKESGTVKGKYTIKSAYISTSTYVASTDALFAIITIRVKDKLSRIEIDPPTDAFFSRKSMGYEIGYTASMFDEAASKLVADFQSRMQGEAIGEW
jgi:hypothetical protein